MNAKAIVCWFFLMLYGAPAVADAEKITASTATSILAAKVIIGLTLVVLLIIAFAWFAKRIGYFSFSTQQCQMRIIGSLALGTREKVIMIEAAGKLILLGVSSRGINNLHTYSEEEALAVLAKMPRDAELNSPTSSLNFSKILKQIVSNDRGEK